MSHPDRLRTGRLGHQAPSPDPHTLLTALGAIGQGIWISDHAHRITYANERMADLIAVPLSKLVGNDVSSERNKTIPRDLKQSYAEAWEAGRPTPYEVALGGPEGEVRWLRGAFVPLTSGGALSAMICVARDETEQVVRIQDLEERLRFAEAIVDRNRDGMIIVDENGKAVRVNARMTEMLGYSAEELLGLHVWDWDETASLDGVRRCVSRIDAQGFQFETRHRRKDGSYLDVEISKSPVVSFGRTLIVGFQRDITRRKEAEAKLRESEAALNRAQALARLGSWVAEKITGYFAVSAEARRILGLDASAEVTREDILARIHPDDRQAVRDRFEAAEPGVPFDFEHRVADAAGIRWVRGRAEIRVGASGEVVSTMGTILDITESKNLEIALRESEFFLRQAQRVGRVGGWRINPEQQSMTCTEEVCLLLELPPEQRLDLSVLLGACSEDLCDGLVERLWQAYRTGDPFVFECPVSTASGKALWLEFRGSPATIDGRIHHVVGTVQDITEHKEALVQLHRAKESAEAANRAKSNFLASMSHELRTPLNAVIGFSDLLSVSEKDPDRQRQLSIIHQAASNLMQLIQDILDLTKIEADRIEVQVAPFDLHMAMEEIASLFDLQAERKGLHFSLTLTPGTPCWVQGDLRLLRQVLINLIGNAIKFTCNGCVEVIVERETVVGKSDAPFVFHVIDTGIGVRPENQERIFGIFEQENGSETRQFAGSGLGLAISKRLVTLMGGQIWLQSEPTVGSRFSFSLPLPPLDALPPIASHRSGQSDPRVEREVWVLVVEDDPFGQQLLARILRECGYRVETAGAGGDALALLAMQRFDLVLLDIQLPGMSGIDVAKQIRSGRVGGYDRSLPIIAVTAYALRGDRERFLSLGFTEYVSKPFNRNDLLTKIEECIGLQGDVHNPAHSPSELVTGPAR